MPHLCHDISRIYHMPFLYKHFHKLHHTYKQVTGEEGKPHHHHNHHHNHHHRHHHRHHRHHRHHYHCHHRHNHHSYFTISANSLLSDGNPPCGVPQHPGGLHRPHVPHGHSCRWLWWWWQCQPFLLFTGVYIFYIMYIYYHGIVDHSGINFKVMYKLISMVISKKGCAPFTYHAIYLQIFIIIGPK